MDRRKKVVSLIHDYKATFSTPHGKRVLSDMMKATGFLSINHVPNDSHGTAFNEGGRNVVVTILKKLRLDVKQLESQLSEGIEDEDF